MIDLDQLEAFVSVATLGGFTKASHQLHRSQPAVSRRIALLEKALDIRLLERKGRDVALTPEGRVLLGYAESALATIKDGIDAVTRSEQPGLPINIAVVGTLADQRLTTALTSFRDEFPESRVSIRTATSREISLLVQRGEADVGIRYYPVSNERLAAISLGDERLCLVARDDSPLGNRPVKRAADLEGVHFLSFPMNTSQPDSFGMMLQRELLKLGITEPDVSFVDSLTAQKRLVEAGYGVALLPMSACREELESGTLRVVEVAAKEFNPSQPVTAIFRRSSTRHMVLRLIEVIRARFPLAQDG